MNRRRRLKRKFRLGQLWAPKRNRRVRIVTSSSTISSAAITPAVAHRDWGVLGRRLAKAGAMAAKIAGVLVALSSVAAGGYYSYKYLRHSPYFTVSTVEVYGVKQTPWTEIQQIIKTQEGQNIFAVEGNTLVATLQKHPWIKEATVRRRMPNKLTINIVEREAEAVLLLGYLYLVSTDGDLFKQATTAEADGRVVITGLSRADYLSNPEHGRKQVKKALQVLHQYREVSSRPALSEINLGSRGEVTLHLRQGGVALRLPPSSKVDDLRLARLDAVWAALGPQASRVRAIYMDNTVRPDRLTVRMSSYQ